MDSTADGRNDSFSGRLADGPKSQLGCKMKTSMRCTKRATIVYYLDSTRCKHPQNEWCIGKNGFIHPETVSMVSQRENFHCIRVF
eukprot:COSAG02_NODE_18955_length_908_cov_2.767614_1_plen_84_part_10